MGRRWVLDTETKGTGAQMVPLDRVLRRPEPASPPIFVPPAPKPPPEPEPPAPRTFKLVDVATQEVLLEDASGRELVDRLKDVRSTVDVRISEWDPEAARWRLLTLREQRAIWALRDRRSPPGPVAARRERRARARS
jgi:hypothetical protein